MKNSHIVENKEHEAVNGSMLRGAVLPSLGHSQKELTIQEVERGPPHEALLLVLAYLPLFELLNMSEVCRRMVGLRTLALMSCTKITDDGLQQVIEKNPLINRLYLPACTGLTPEGIMRAVKTLTEHYQALKCVRINGVYNMKKEHLETLSSYLQMNPAKMEGQMQQLCFFHDHRNISVLRVEESYRPIDLEICPRCNEVRMVFDCPRETCKKKRERAMAECRGCYFCIPRCEECGKCIEVEEPGEVVCADVLCSDCWLQLPKCNFCNRPYCSRHANLQHSTSGYRMMKGHKKA
ncbi:F-box protein SKIP28 [Vitis vinifera]|uniref:F-box protein SKIP28 n=1 Tax=Vitis vinifera TaxID=29760 RepID=A0A438JUQ7_VITVI|nr:F-box protein SKIP28 [Vitis vinifera]